MMDKIFDTIRSLVLDDALCLEQNTRKHSTTQQNETLLRGCLTESDATVGVGKRFLTFELLGAPHLIRTTTDVACGSTPVSPSQCATSRDIPNEFANRDALTHIVMHLESLGASEQDKDFASEAHPLPGSVHKASVIYPETRSVNLHGHDNKVEAKGASRVHSLLAILVS